MKGTGWKSNTRCSVTELLQIVTRNHRWLFCQAGHLYVTDHAPITWLIMHWSRNWSCTDHLADHALITWLIILSSVDWSYTDHVTDHALIYHVLVTWLSCTEYVAEHALFRWLITHLSRDITCTDHVALMHWSRGWSYTAHVSDHAW